MVWKNILLVTSVVGVFMVLDCDPSSGNTDSTVHIIGMYNCEFLSVIMNKSRTRWRRCGSTIMVNIFLKFNFRTFIKNYLWLTIDIFFESSHTGFIQRLVPTFFLNSTIMMQFVRLRYARMLTAYILLSCFVLIPTLLYRSKSLQKKVWK